MDLTPEQVAEVREAIKNLRVEIVRVPTEAERQAEARRERRGRIRAAFLRGFLGIGGRKR